MRSTVFASIVGDLLHKLPNPLDLAKDVAGAPFRWLLNELHHWMLGLVANFEHDYTHMAGVTVGPWADYYIGSGVGLARYLAVAGFAAVLMVMALIPGAARNIGRVAKGFFAVMLAPLVFWVIDTMGQVQVKLAHVAVDMYTPTGKFANQPLLLIPIVENPIGAFAGMTSIAFFGGILEGIFKTYVWIALVATVVLLPLLALGMLFNWAEKASNVTISALLLTKMLGIPFALFILKIAQAVVGHTPALQDSLGYSMSIVGAVIVAITMQAVLFWAGLKVVSPITGNIYSRGRSQIEGKVKGEVTQKKPSQRQRQDAYARSFVDRGGNAQTVNSESATRAAARKQAVRTGAMALAKRYPATAVAVTAASKVAEKRGSSSRNGTGGASAPSTRQPTAKPAPPGRTTGGNTTRNGRTDSRGPTGKRPKGS